MIFSSMDHDLCHHGKPWPCSYCVFDRLVGRYDTREDTLYNVTTDEACDSIDE